MENMHSTFEKFMINTNKNYDEELNELITGYNASVLSVLQGISIVSLISLLVEKNIITNDEIDTKFSDAVENSKEFQNITKYGEEIVSFLENMNMENIPVNLSNMLDDENYAEDNVDISQDIIGITDCD